MLYAGGVIGLLLLAVYLYTLLDVLTSDPAAVRNLPKIAWFFIVLLTFEIGVIIWWIAGRPQQARTGGTPYKGNRGVPWPAGRTAGFPEHERPRPLAPDDDPEFLRRAEQSMAEDKDLLAKWEADLKRREDELRRRGQSGDDPA